MKKFNKFFMPNRQIFMAGGPEGGKMEEGKKPEGQKPQGEYTPGEAQAKGANVIDAGQNQLDQLSGKEKMKEEAQQYCKDIETRMSSSIQKLMATESGALPGKPNPDDPRYKGKDGEDNFKKDNDAYNKKYEAYQAEVKKMIPQLLSGMKKPPAAENAKVVDRIAKQEGADSQQGGAQTTSATPSYLAEKIYLNYKINVEADGGWAVKQDLSDVPSLVEDGSISLSKFKTRSDTMQKAVSDAAAQLETARKKYS